ncbi:thioesterase [Actibacterium mucosum KCTC 23349]|uniref:Thioesterase n=1 Tax=Actibacterium mucosum KCTC 23349 TaxID=1454373 RepID=A0A037ZLX5_9RHOB|nr:PaaI family thioesterase [Actibacterium mucosum]KAJ56547.1 thioesterase [Actibacterium mucosum KCTC 23349]
MTQFFAQSPDQVLPQSELLKISGLDFMQGILDGKIAGPPICRLMNFHLASVAKGEVVFEGAPEFAASNPIGSIHGGWYGTVLDSCMACAVMTTVPQGSFYTTLEYKVNITRAIPVGMAMRATGRIQHGGRRTGVADGALRGLDDGKLYATGTTTCLIMKGV